ncbi:hypothetical protein BJP44_01890 [Candidatus Williamhamiltonella defendens]|nr:hypothetical protein BJP44_01890 [Candidatus Hamiltonella defensa]
MHWKIPGIMAALLLSLLSAVLYYRHQYQQAENARQQVFLDIVQHQKVFEQWMMHPPPDLLTPLNGIISLSERLSPSQSSK